MEKINIIKIGGNIIDHDELLDQFISDIIKINEPVILIHGGGKIATEISNKLGIKSEFIDGRRITKSDDLQVAIMVYGGLINKKICAKIQLSGRNSIGLSGVDLGIIPAKRKKSEDIDWGYVGIPEINKINGNHLIYFLEQNILPVLAPLSLDETGQVCNTNADTIAMGIAISLSSRYRIDLHYCFEKEGVLGNNGEIISKIDSIKFEELKEQKIVKEGIIPKIEESLNALKSGVNRVFIYHAKDILDQIKTANNGTEIIKSFK